MTASRLQASDRVDRLTNEVSVLVVCHVGTVWGAQRALLDLAPRLARAGVRLTMACPEGELGALWREQGLDHEVLDLPAHRGLRQDGTRRRPGPAALARELTAVGRSARRIARRGRHFDVIQSSSLWAHLETAVAGKLARRPVVLDLHDIVDEGAGRTVLGMAARVATVTLANSAATAATVPRSVRTVRIVHPGIDTDRFRPGPANDRVRAELSANPAAPLIAIIGRVDPNKGIGVLVEAAARLDIPHASPHVVVIGREHVGSREQADQLRDRARAALGDRVRFLPPRDDIPDVLRSVDVLVNASRHEPFGLTVVEAQACGTAVIGTDAGGIPEFVEDGRTGLLVPPFDPIALESALRRVLTDDDLRRRLAATAADQALERFGVEAQAASAAEVYRSLAPVRGAA